MSRALNQVDGVWACLEDGVEVRRYPADPAGNNAAAVFLYRGPDAADVTYERQVIAHDHAA